MTYSKIEDQKMVINAESITKKSDEFKAKIRWPDFIAQIFLHFGLIYGFVLFLLLKVKLFTFAWCKSTNLKIFKK